MEVVCQERECQNQFVFDTILGTPAKKQMPMGKKVGLKNRLKWIGFSNNHFEDRK